MPLTTTTPVADDLSLEFADEVEQLVADAQNGAGDAATKAMLVGATVICKVREMCRRRAELAND